MPCNKVYYATGPIYNLKRAPDEVIHDTKKYYDNKEAMTTKRQWHNRATKYGNKATSSTIQIGNKFG